MRVYLGLSEGLGSVSVGVSHLTQPRHRLRSAQRLPPPKKSSHTLSVRVSAMSTPPRTKCRPLCRCVGELRACLPLKPVPIPPQKKQSVRSVCICEGAIQYLLNMNEWCGGGLEWRGRGVPQSE